VELLEKWGIDKNRAEAELEHARQNSRMQRLVENPLLLSLIAMLLDEKESIPATRVELYRKATTLMLHRQTDAAGGPKLLHSPDEAMKVLQYIALELHGRSGVAYPRADVVEVLSDAPARYRTWIREHWGDMDGYLRQISSTNLFIPDEELQLYSFPHRTFREYLSALALQQEIRGYGLPDVDPAVLKAVVEGKEIPEPSVPEAFRQRMAAARQDAGTWAEVLALCCALDPDGADVLVRRTAVHGGLELVRRVVADAEGLQADTLLAVLGMAKGGNSWRMRSKVIAELPTLTGDLRAAVDLCWRFVQTTRNGADLWFARSFFQNVANGQVTEKLQAEDETEVLGKARSYAARIFDHIPKTDLARAEGMIRWVEAPGKGGKLEFWMGSRRTGKSLFQPESPQHKVTFATGFLVMKTPVTNTLYECLDPEHSGDREEFNSRLPVKNQDDVPAYNLTWYEAQVFSEWIGTAVHGSRLPLEAEWEYFSGAGTTTERHYKAADSVLMRDGWYNPKVGVHPTPVGQREPNAWGLHDCLENVWQWCLDEYKTYHDGNLMLDPRVLNPSDTLSWNNANQISVGRDIGRVIRGGSWNYDARCARSAFRGSRPPSARENDVGFRLIRVLQQD
jgi:formylglycine-generating enzyme required for sulfatase activity